MIPKSCKRLAEVDFPIAVVSKHSAREKSIRHGHPSTLHLWWARRPLAACRAMLLALLLPDPCDPHCPKEFRDRARRALLDVPGAPGNLRTKMQSEAGLRTTLLTFIGDVANWDVANSPEWIRVARELVKAAHPEETPLVVDPFAGGGSIPLEALRLGCEAFASDLNPVACLILKVMLEDIPRHGPELAEELRRVGKEIKEKAEKELAEFYPDDPDGAKPIAYIWARTVTCESPNCGGEIPLIRSMWLCSKPKRSCALHIVSTRWTEAKGEAPELHLLLVKQPLRPGTVSRAKASCPHCGAVLSPDRVRVQLREQHGGADVIFDKKGSRVGGARLLAVVMLKDGATGRQYRLSTERDYQAVWKAQKRVNAVLDEWKRGGNEGLCPVPDEALNAIRPSPDARGLSAVTRYGMLTFGDLFSARQKMALLTFADLICEASGNASQACVHLLAIAMGRAADATSSLTRWLASGEEVKNVFCRQALAMVWDSGETNPLSDVSRSWNSALDSIENVLTVLGGCPMPSGQVQQADSCHSPLPDLSVATWFTDPPYYDAIPYADLSDFFFVWLKRALRGHPLLRDPFDPGNVLTPKSRECVWNQGHLYQGRPKDKMFFESTMNRCFIEGRRVLRDEGVAGVVFAHQTTEGWEAFLSGLTAGGWTVTGSWPIATEMVSRIRARDNASLATSVHLVCRPRPHDAPVGDWGEVLGELPKRVGDWMERLQAEGVRGADLVFACIGPALEIFSRYRKVETAEGREVPLAEYLEKVWEVVGRSALEQVLGTAEAKARNGGAGALEEDARLTALFLWTMQSTETETTGTAEGAEGAEDGPDRDGEEDGDEEGGAGGAKGKKTAKGFSLPFDVVRRFAQPLGISLPGWEGRVVATEKGVVRLISINDRAQVLFGEEDARAIAHKLETASTGPTQGMLFPELMNQGPEIRAKAPKGRGRSAGGPPAKGAKDAGKTGEPPARRQPTTLDRVHAAMLLQASGQSNALRMLLKAEQDRGPDFLRLANALSALYPKDSEEKRLLDAMLLAVRR